MRPQIKACFLMSVAAIVAGSCAPQPAATGPSRASQPGATTASPPTTLTIAVGGEVDALATKLGGGTFGGDFHFLTNSPLVARNSDGNAAPLLAAELPSRDGGTWTVNPDGTMATTWKIKANAKWHDGRPVVSADFVFALNVYLDEGVTIRVREPERLMGRIEALDSKTFVIHWTRPYPWANELGSGEFEPLPEHIMGNVYGAIDPEAFLNHPLWSTTEYVGTGPYRLVQWDPGNQLIFREFDEYFMGRPKIDEVILRIIADQNTLVANLLGGHVDTAARNTLDLHGAITIRNQWRQTGEGEVLVTPERWRFVQVQFDPAYNRQPALLDLRVRRAIVHAIDREALAEVVSGGIAAAAETFLTPTDPLYPQAQRVIMKYPHDPRAAMALLQQAGWAKRGDALVNAAGEPFTLDLRFLQGTANETEASIIAADLSKLGMQMTQTPVPKARSRDNEYRNTFPGLTQSARPIKVPTIMRDWVPEQCPDPTKRFTGGNRGCWKNAEYDRLYGVATTSLDPAERSAAIVGAVKVMTEEVGIFGLRYDPESIPVRKGLVGPAAYWPAQASAVWNIHEWRWER